MLYRTSPPASRIAETFAITIEEAQRVRDALKTGRGLARAFKGLSGFYGVEHVAYVNGDHAFTYISTGDTYSPTVVRRDGSTAYRISTMGDEVEALERAGRKIA
jgi:hypothetical protein